MKKIETIPEDDDDMDTEITDKYAKDHFFELLDQVEQGQSFTITIDGKPVAQMRPSAEVVERLGNPSINGAFGDTVLE